MNLSSKKFFFYFVEFRLPCPCEASISDVILNHQKMLSDSSKYGALQFSTGVSRKVQHEILI